LVGNFANSVNDNLFLVACKTDFLLEVKRCLPEKLEVIKQGIVNAFEHTSLNALTYLLGKYQNQIDIFTLCIEPLLANNRWKLEFNAESIKCCAVYLPVIRLRGVYCNTNYMLQHKECSNEKIVDSLNTFLIERIAEGSRLETYFKYGMDNTLSINKLHAFNNTLKLSAFILCAQPGNLPKDIYPIVSLFLWASFIKNEPEVPYAYQLKQEDRTQNSHLSLK